MVWLRASSAVAVTILSLTAQAHADSAPLAPYSATGHVTIGPENAVVFPCATGIVPANCTFTNNDNPTIGGGPGVGSVSISATNILPNIPDTSITVSASGSPLQTVFAVGDFTYDFALSTLNSDIPLPATLGIIVNSTISFTTPRSDGLGDSVGGGAFIEISDSDGNVLLDDATTGVHHDPVHLNLAPFTVFTVTLQADASIEAFNSSEAATAAIDPTITIDPSDPNASDFVVQLSPGLDTGGGGLAAGAPEPSTWAMLALGFAGLGAMGWRSRRKRATAAI